MSNSTDIDDFELIGRAYRRYWYAIRNWCVVLLSLLLFAVAFGVPHIQTTYTYTGYKPPGEGPSAAQKLDAWYFSVTGWKHLDADQYGYHGCPVIMFVPLSECLIREPMKGS